MQRQPPTRLLSDIAYTLESPQDVEARLRMALQLLNGLVPYDRCALFQTGFDGTGQLMVVPDVGPSEQGQMRAELARLLSLMEELQRKDGDAATLKWRNQLDGWGQSATGWQSRLAMPLISLDRVVGLLAVGQQTPAVYGEDDVGLLAIVAAQLAAFVSAVQAVERLSVLQRITAEVGAALTVLAVADVVLAHSMADLGATGGIVSLLCDDGAHFRNLRIVGAGAEVVAAWTEYRLTVPTPLSDAVRDRDLVLVDSPAMLSARYPADVAVGATGMCAAYMAMPLLVGERGIGCLGLSFDDARAFCAEGQRFMRLLGELSAQALERARLRESEQRTSQLLAERTLQGQEEERKRIARELHDGTAQSLSTLLIHLDRLEKQLPGRSSDASSEFARVRTLAQRALDEIRSLAHDLRPSILDDVGLVAALHWLGDEYERTFDLKVDLDADQAPGGGLSPEMETFLFRIAQEAIHNSAQHGEASTVSVLLSFRGGVTRLVVEDDGCGFQTGQLGWRNGWRGFGLAGMKERASLMGGSCAVDSWPGKGTKVTVVVPLRAPSAPQGEGLTDIDPSGHMHLLAEGGVQS